MRKVLWMLTTIVAISFSGCRLDSSTPTDSSSSTDSPAVECVLDTSTLDSCVLSP